MGNYVLAYAFFTVLVLVFARWHGNGATPLSWLATVFLVVTANVAVTYANRTGGWFASKLFLVIMYGAGETMRSHLSIVWASRTAVIISNGERMGKGGSQALQALSIAFCGCLLLVIFLVVRSCLARVAPKVYSEYARHFRQWFHPR
jgi:hypothetical protein